MRIIEIPTETPYRVILEEGLIDRAGEHIAALSGAGRVLCITDDTVAALYGDRLMISLRGAGIEPIQYAFPSGEYSKNLRTVEDILEFMGEAQMTRADWVVALGGGVVGDIAGLCAALYGRGISYVQIPTTLLAAVDSSVGGKTGVNLRSGKNLAGVFKQPALVLCDTRLLRALPDDRIADGAAEMIKCGILADPVLFDSLEARDAFLEMDKSIARCIAIKRDCVVGDERDVGKRQLLNLGHTFGHAMERLSGYSLPHGQAVGLGMRIIARAAQGKGFLRAEDLNRIERTITAHGLTARCPYHASELLEAIHMDKKRRGDRITLIVPVRIGHCEQRTIAMDDVREWIVAGGI